MPNGLVWFGNRGDKALVRQFVARGCGWSGFGLAILGCGSFRLCYLVPHAVLAGCWRLQEKSMRSSKNFAGQ
jgi:hypothetical protein